MTYYVCADFEQSFYDDFCKKLLGDQKSELFASEIPEGVEVTTRENDKESYVFVQNFGEEPVELHLAKTGYSPLAGTYDGTVGKYGTVVFHKEK